MGLPLPDTLYKYTVNVVLPLPDTPDKYEVNVGLPLPDTLYKYTVNVDLQLPDTPYKYTVNVVLPFHDPHYIIHGQRSFTVTRYSLITNTRSTNFYPDRILLIKSQHRFMFTRYFLQIYSKRGFTVT